MVGLNQGSGGAEQCPFCAMGGHVFVPGFHDAIAAFAGSRSPFVAKSPAAKVSPGLPFALCSRPPPTL